MAASPLTIEFVNNSGYDDSDVSVGFYTGPGNPVPVITNKNGNTPIQPLSGGAWYTRQTLSKGVSVTSFVSGRIYVCYGPTWTPSKDFPLPAQNVTDPSFYYRYDKLELNYTGSQYDVADLTAIDYWSIPISLNGLKNGSVVSQAVGLKGNTTAKDLWTALNSLTTPPVSGLTEPGGTDGLPMPALVPGQYVQYPKGPAPGKTFARIIGPSSYAAITPAGIPVQPYDTMRGYLSWLNTTFGPGTAVGATVPTLGNGVIAKIAGEFGGVGNPPPATGPQAKQSYNLSATIDSNLDITLTGTMGSVSGTQTMLFKMDDLLNPSGIYGGNAKYYLNGDGTNTAPGNDVYGWSTGDLLTGINVGAVGSSYKHQGTDVGALQSSKWFNIPTTSLFGVLQPHAKYYNQWAATLQPLSEAYNFAYTDRFAHVFVTLDPTKVDTLQVVLLKSNDLPATSN